MYRYFTNSEAKAEVDRREDEGKKRVEEHAAQGKPDGAGRSGMKLPDPPAAAQTAPEAPAKTGMKLPDPPAATQGAPAAAK
jgi:hypothetical protein